MIKKVVRAQALEKRNLMSSDKKKFELKQVLEQIQKDANYIDAKTIAVYQAFGSELNLEDLTHPEATFCYPKIVKDELVFYEVNEKTEWERSKFDILEPKSGKIVETIDYMLIPSLAINERKHRLGYGKGYYDRYLAKQRPKHVVAPIFTVQQVSFTEETHDQMIDYVIVGKELTSIIETEVGTFEIIKNYREAFNLVLFLEKYVDVAFDRYTYLVGDLSSDKLRIKGFSQDAKSANSFKMIPDYLSESCNFNTAYFILKRIKEKKGDNRG